jgi:peptidoglycan/LPS O-acetylase OafA/YrhL
MQRLPQLDVARAIAILMVMGVHAGQCVPNLSGAALTVANQGARGVQLFFVASAFALMLAWHARNDGVVPFYIRRLFRIAPMFWLAMIGFLSLSGLSSRYYAPDGIGWGHVAATALFLNGFWPSAITSVVPGGWTIVVEMMFYLLFPLAVLALRGWVSCSTALVVSIFLADYQYVHGQPFATSLFDGQDKQLAPQLLWFWLPNQLPAFLTGMLAYHCWNFLALRDLCSLSQV